MFGTAGKISDHVTRDKAIVNADITTDRTSAWFPMTNYRQALARLETGTVADTKVATVGFEQATSSGGAGAKIVGVDTIATSDGGEELSLEREIEVTDLDTAGGFDHIRVKVTSDDGGTVLGVAVLLRDRGRY